MQMVIPHCTKMLYLVMEHANPALDVPSWVPDFGDVSPRSAIAISENTLIAIWNSLSICHKVGSWMRGERES